MVVLGDFPDEAITSAPDEPILDVKAHGVHVACLTETTVQLWLSGPHIRLLGTAEHAAHEVAQIGGFRKLAWHPDGSTLVVTVRPAQPRALVRSALTHDAMPAADAALACALLPAGHGERLAAEA